MIQIIAGLAPAYPAKQNLIHASWKLFRFIFFEPRSHIVIIGKNIGLL
jgi:hypothetical protein